MPLEKEKEKKAAERDRVREEKKNEQGRARELERTVSLCSCSRGCFWITSVLCQRKERRTDRQGIRERRERGTLHKSGLLVWEGGPGSVLGVLSDRAVIVRRLKWVKPGLNSAAGPPRHHRAPPSTSWQHSSSNSTLPCQLPAPEPHATAPRLSLACSWDYIALGTHSCFVFGINTYTSLFGQQAQGIEAVKQKERKGGTKKYTEECKRAFCCF